MMPQARIPGPEVALPPTAAVRPEESPAAAPESACYEGELPAFIGPALERLYGSCFASLAHQRIHGPGQAFCAYVARVGEEVRVVLLFRIEGLRLLVLNEVVTLEGLEVARFVDFVFARYAAVQVVLLRAVQCGPLRCARPWQRVNHLEDIVIALPDTAAAYAASLGKNTRHNLRRYGARLRERYPDCRFTLQARAQIDTALVDDILRLSRLRMAGKHRSWGMRAAQVTRLVEEARLGGLAGAVTIEGRLAAGALGLRSGDHFHLFVIAHDPAYDAWSLGFLCCFEMISAAIAQGCKEFHFLWGEYDYKTALGGRRRELDNLAFYRSPMQLLQHGGLAAGLAWRGFLRRAKARLRPWRRRLAQAHVDLRRAWARR